MKAHLKLSDQDEQVDLLIQTGHSRHHVQELLRLRQLVKVTAVLLQRLGLLLLWSNLVADKM